MKTLEISSIGDLCRVAQTPLACIERVWAVQHFGRTKAVSYIYKTESDGYDNGFGFDIPAYFAMTIEALTDPEDPSWDTPYRTLDEAFDAAQP